MAILRRDDWLTTPQGQALAGAQVYYCTQPATTDENPPSPLATIYSNSGGTPAAQPVLTDGYGHAVAYLNDGQPYTVVFFHPLLGEPLVLEDQLLSGGNASGGVTPFGPVTPTGPINGTNTTFTLAFTPTLLLLTHNGVLLTEGVGYTAAVVSGVFTITMAQAPKAGANFNAAGIR